MLRLGPTAIGLDARDLAWHQSRQDRRLTARREELQQTFCQAHESLSFNSKSGPSEIAECIPQFAHNEQEREKGKILSGQPVPRNSRAFWDGILAATGTPARSQDVSFLDVENAESSAMAIERAPSPAASPSLISGNDPDTELTNERPLTRSSTVVRKKDLRKHYGVVVDPSQSEAAMESSNIATSPFMLSEAEQDFQSRVSNASQRPANSHIDRSADRYESVTYRPGRRDSELSMGSRRTDFARSTAHERGASSSTDSSAPITPIYDEEAANRSRRGLWESQSSLSPPASSQHRVGLLSHPPRRRAQRAYRLQGRFFGTSEHTESTSAHFPQLDGLGASPATLGEGFSQISLEDGDEGSTSPTALINARAEDPGLQYPTQNVSTDSTVERGAPSQYITHSPFASQQVSSGEAARIRHYSSLTSLSSGSVRESHSFSSLSFTPLLSHDNQIDAPRPTLPLPPPFSSTPRNLSYGSPSPPFNQRASPQQTGSHNRSSSRAQSPYPIFPVTLYSPQSSSGHFSQGHNHTPNTPSPSSRPISRTSHRPNHSLAVYNDSISPSTQPQTPADLRHLRLAGRSSAVTNAASAPPRLATRGSRGLSWTQPAAFAVRDTQGRGDASPTRTNRYRFPSRPSDRGNSPRPTTRHGEAVHGLGSGLGLGTGRARQLMAMRNEAVENEGRVTQEEREWRRNRAGWRGH